MKLNWRRTSEAWPDSSWLPTCFTLFNEHKPHREGDGLWDTYVAGVHQIDAGPQAGMWTWSVTATFPGPRCPYASNGVQPTRKVAAEKATETYRKMVEFYRVHMPPRWQDHY
ncbi:hypothetical protein [Microvirga splendida]|uniref:Uncharacterized protein n=1 Tax=Microvirga splendida TaxID=2795727 RepID=A0ABS0XZC6_9HYPH|nr:hypothetical protein [Microvirga splendida]MBJ6125409.1 hypothetical protein [Microvirga splendida]